MTHWASRHGRYRIDSNSDSLLNDAVSRGDIQFVRDLVATGASLRPNAEGVTPLREAVASQQTSIVCLLLACGADANARTLGGGTAMHSAAGLGRADYVRMFLAAGADVRTADSAGYTPLMYATEGAGLDVIKLLVEHGADGNEAHRRDGQTPVLFAARGCKLDVVGYLLDRGADPYTEDAAGMADNALIAAAVQDRADNVRALVAKGVAVDRRNRDGLTALMAIASSWGRHWGDRGSAPTRSRPVIARSEGMDRGGNGATREPVPEGGPPRRCGARAARGGTAAPAAGRHVTRPRPPRTE